MAGVKGRSGRRRLPIEVKVLRGTYRPDRDGPLPSKAPISMAATAPGLRPAVAPIPETVTVGLGTADLRFVADFWAEHEEFSTVEITLLRAAGKALDDAETAATPKERRLALRLFASIAQQLVQGTDQMPAGAAADASAAADRLAGG
jgi:hypothetical protein